MKHSILLLLSLMVIFSCENTQFPGYPQEPPAPQVELILKELNLVQVGPSNTLLNSYFFNTSGIPTHTDLATDDLTFESAEIFNFNANEEIESWKAEIPSWEPSAPSTFEYENGQLINIVRAGLGFSLPISYDFDYLESSIEVNAEPLYPLAMGTYIIKLIFNFSDSTYQELLSIEYYEVDNPVLNKKIEFEYDSQGNISSTQHYEFEEDTNQLELVYNATFTYDNKVNPFRRLFNEDPIIVIYQYVLRPANFSIFNNSHFSPNNILSINATRPDVYNSINNFTYEYNEFNHPVSSIEEEVFSNFLTGEETINIPDTRTYIYYEQ